MLSKSAIYSILSIIFKMLSGPLALMLIATGLTKIEQGVYFTFISLSSIQWIFELGITTCVVQFLGASREGKKRYYISFLIYFMLLSVVLLLLALMTLSKFLFENIAYEIWFLPWFIYSVLVCLNMFFGSFIVIEEGAGNVDKAYKVRFLSSVFYTLILMISLYLDCKLFSLALAQFAMLVPAIVMLRSRFLSIQNYFTVSKKRLRLIFNEVISFQSKLSLVWIFGYLYWNSFSIIFFKYVSPEYAGEFGAINSIFSAIAAISVALISTKRVPWGELNSLGLVAVSYSEFKRYLLFSLLIFLIFSMFFLGFMFTFPNLEITHRFLPLDEVIVFAVLRLLILLQEFSLLYLRTFKDEPLYIITSINYVTMPFFIILSLTLSKLLYVYILVSIIQFIFMVCYFLFLNSYVRKRI
ncbi:hypothetical protein [Aeromonas veronii]|uniref:hypothetical protein n=1 Tax=Aeromonas veronii TaxID=654 RepID=UPI003D22C1A5